MKKRQICIGLISLAMVSLTACDDAKTSEAVESQITEAETFEAGESQATEAETFEADESQVSEPEALDEADVQTSESETSEISAAEPNTYGVNTTSMGNGTGSEYEISDMLPPLSDDTFIMTVEEAEAFMNKNANKGADAEVEIEEPDEPEE